MKEAHRNCNPCEPTKENQRIRFVSPHHRVGLQNSDLLLKLAKEIKLKISQNMGVSQKSLARFFFFHNSLSHRRQTDLFYEMLGKLRQTSYGELSLDQRSWCDGNWPVKFQPVKFQPVTLCKRGMASNFEK